jgi:flavin-dependent dehydrogenase
VALAGPPLDFDKMMLDVAVARGATLITGKAVRPLLDGGGAVRGVQVRMADSKVVEEVECEVLLDCSGQATWLSNLSGVTGPKYLGTYDKQIAIFSQVTGRSGTAAAPATSTRTTP